MNSQAKELKPEDVIDRYYCFKKEDLLAWVAQRGNGVELTAANIIQVFNQMQEEIGKRYFVMDSGDPLVATVVVAYTKLLNAQERLQKKAIVQKAINDVRHD